MSSANRSLIVGRVCAYRIASGQAHATLLIRSGRSYINVKINVRSMIPPHTLMFSGQGVSEQLSEQLKVLDEQVFKLGARSELSLDYIRDYLMDRSDALRIPYSINDSANPVMHWLSYRFGGSALQAQMPKIYVWGQLQSDDLAGSEEEPWVLHDIHMNQGNYGLHQTENRVDGDGGLICEHANGEMSALYLAFTSQSWDTDDRDGHPIGLHLPDSVIETDAVIRIVSALLGSNDVPAKSSVTLINRSDRNVSLDHWRLEDHQGDSQSLRGVQIEAGACLQIPLDPDYLTFRAQGGVLRLLAERDCLVHEVAYKAAAPLAENWSILFKG